MIHIPDEITVGGITYKIEFTDDIKTGYAAQIYYHEGLIEISDTLNNEVAFVSLCHELVHAIYQQQSIFIKDMAYVDEPLVEVSGQLIAQIFKQLMEYNRLKDEEQPTKLNIKVEV